MTDDTTINAELAEHAENMVFSANPAVSALIVALSRCLV
jgi:hypothetical protein